MATVVTDMTMSLDGFIADPSDGVDDLFGWYETGPVEVPAPAKMAFHVTVQSARNLRELIDRVGAFVCGRRLFDVTDGWEGQHPFDVPVFVVTHSAPKGRPREGESTTFVTDGVESAIAQAGAVAGDGIVMIQGADVASQCIDAGLVDEVRVNLAPVLMGTGIRYFDKLSNAPIRFDDPEVIEGGGVTHLRFRALPSA
jgi:dihydrofolate reductase